MKLIISELLHFRGYHATNDRHEFLLAHIRGGYFGEGAFGFAKEVFQEKLSDDDSGSQNKFRRRRSSEDRFSILRNSRQFGALLAAAGLLLMIGGMMLFFEANLLRIGNISFILGLLLLIGPDNVRRYFAKSHRIQATLITATGIALVLYGKPRLGILLELFGLLNLFGNMLPLLLSLAKRLPVVGDLIAVLESVFGLSDQNQHRRQRGNGYSGGRDSESIYDRDLLKRRYERRRENERNLMF